MNDWLWRLILALPEKSFQSQIWSCHTFLLQTLPCLPVACGIKSKPLEGHPSPPESGPCSRFQADLLLCALSQPMNFQLLASPPAGSVYLGPGGFPHAVAFASNRTPNAHAYTHIPPLNERLSIFQEPTREGFQPFRKRRSYLPSGPHDILHRDSTSRCVTSISLHVPLLYQMVNYLKVGSMSWSSLHASTKHGPKLRVGSQ